MPTATHSIPITTGTADVLTAAEFAALFFTETELAALMVTTDDLVAMAFRPETEG